MKTLLFMIFLHIVDDYYLQGILASMKQKAWWQKQESYCDKYKHDYIVALIIHAFSWAFMITLPFILSKTGDLWVTISVLLNACIHFIVDDLKANKKKINLIQDQAVHFAQIMLTWAILFHTLY